VDDFYRTPEEASSAVELLWPLGWCILAGAILLIRRGRLGQATRSLLAALIAGFLASSLNFVVLAAIGLAWPWLDASVLGFILQLYLPVLVIGKFRVLAFLVCLAVAVAIWVMPLRETAQRLAVRGPR
jgi:hypothetical protein